MGSSEYQLEMVCSEPTRQAAITTLFFERQENISAISRQPIIPRILLRIYNELLMPEKYNLGIDRATLYVILIVRHRFPEMSAAITYIYNQFSAIRGKIPVLFNAELLTQHIEKIKVWADTQLRSVIGHYCQEAITVLRRIERPELPASIYWKQVPKTSSSVTTSVPESQATNVTEIVNTTINTSEMEKQSIQNDESTEPQKVISSSSASEVTREQSTEETPQVSPTVSETPRSFPSVAKIVESIPAFNTASPEANQSLIQIATKFQTITTTRRQSESTPSNISGSSERTNKRPSSDLHDKSTESTQLTIKRRLLQSPQSVREVGSSGRAPNSTGSTGSIREGKLEDLDVPCGTVVTILSRGYMGSTAVYVGPSKTRTHRRVIIMDKMGPLQTHLYGDTRARVESSQITHEVSIEENTREVSGTLADLLGDKFTYNRSIVVRITQENSPYKDKLASAFNSWSDNALIWIHGETAPRYLDNATRVVFYVPEASESPTD